MSSSQNFVILRRDFKMKKAVVILLLVFTSITASAQLLYTIDEFLSARYYKADYDTAYIGRPLGSKWTLAFRSYLNWTTYDITGTAEDIPVGFHLRSELNPKLSIYAGYLGFGASLTRSFKKLAGKQEADWNFKFSTYGNRFGMAFSMSAINSMKGYFSFRSDPYYITMDFDPEDTISQISMYGNFYFAVNKKKFSYPAAFSYSYIQKHSAGSILIGGAVNVNITSVRLALVDDSIKSSEMVHVTNAILGAGVGYAYNLVLKNNWMIHASVLPYLVVIGGTQYQLVDGEEKSSASEFPESFIVSRAAVIHTMGRWFAGGSGQLNFYNIRCDNLKASCREWEIIAFVGVRL